MKSGILYLVGQLGTGGLERQLYYLLQTLDRERYNPTVVVWNDCEADTYTAPIRALGVPVYSFPRTFSVLAKLTTLRRLVLRLQPEVAHSYSFYTNIAVYWATRGTRTVAVGSVRGEFIWTKQESGRWIGSLSARWPRDQVCNSFSACKAAQRARQLFTPRRLLVVRNGLDLEYFRYVSPSFEGKAYLVGVGSLLSVKRWDRLLRVTLELKRRGLDFLVRLVGDGPLRDALRQQAQSFGITDRVEFLGKSDDIPSVLAKATVLVHPSDSEGCPNAVMEAMACGRAVVATNVGDIPLLVEDGKTGFLVPRENETALAARLATLISDHELCRRMGSAARVKAEQEFSLERLVAETLAAYRLAGWTPRHVSASPSNLLLRERDQARGICIEEQNTSSGNFPQY